MAKRFLPVFIFLALLTGGIISSFYYSDVKQERRLIEIQEKNIPTLQNDVIASIFRNVVADLMFLVDHHEFLFLLDGHKGDVKKYLGHDFLAFLLREGRYDQIRYLDESGMEIVRYNYNKGRPLAIPQYKLQNKADRYYFRDTIVLKRGEIFISPMDLNKEHGKIEQPIKPMIRFATPVFDSKGKKKGVVILNYFGSILLKNLRKAAEGSQGEVSLLNADGYWFMGPDPEKEWGFMYRDKKDARFESVFPKAWQTISTEESGQFITSSGLFTFSTVYPFREIGHASVGGAETSKQLSTETANGGYSWKIVSRISPEMIKQVSERLLRRYEKIYAIMLLALGLISWLFAKQALQKKQVEELLRLMAYSDSLTGLPNRNTFQSVLKVEIAHSKRYKRRIAVMFLDLDGFKQVNDTFGHGVGDELLKYVAQKLRASVREGDTVARLGGDEFTILLTQVLRDDDALKVANKIISLFKEPVEINGKMLKIGTSIGIAVYPRDGNDPDTLVKHADEAMYRAKQGGKNRLEMYRKEGVET